MKLPNKKYQIIYADPPWKYRENDKKRLLFEHESHGEIFGNEHFYNTMNTNEIMEMNIPSDKNCWLFLWATATKLNDAINVLEAWGFDYWTCAIWDKEHLGLGWFFRIQHEILLIGKKGKPITPKNKVRSIFKEKRTTFSKKPKCIRKWIEESFPKETKIELFARERYEGWDGWGNELPNTIQKYIN